jgi:D-alanyl-lipoteichoic acid acyltransferase DltB (MBOAT superfamily)
MLFNSYVFLFAFLPITLLGYYLIGKTKYARLTIPWLVAASLVFYGLYNPFHIPLIIFSIAFNFAIGITLTRQNKSDRSRLLLVTGITINILLLGYFKYTNFFIDNVNILFKSDLILNTIILPLGISFFTIQQIAYLVDAYRGELGKHNFIDYCLFVAFFPKLISGPIVRFNEIMPQIVRPHLPGITKQKMAVGITIVIFGLFKKVILADNIGIYADSVFGAVMGNPISFFDAWIGALAYTFQLYFDFSGYCDIAIGIALMFGIRLPLNFFSPYLATSIIDFWRRWHITLSRFIRDYLYIPLGGNRKGFSRQILNLLVVMAIAGLWHGAGWTFIVWGTLHGLYLAINHVWRRLTKKSRQAEKSHTIWGNAISIFVTFIAVTVAWVFFRADTLTAAIEIVKGMIGMNGFILPASLYDMLGILGPPLKTIGVAFTGIVTASPISAGIWIFVSLVICWFLPNVQEYMSNFNPTLDSFTEEGEKHLWRMRWDPSFWRTVVLGVMATVVVLGLTHVSEFIYSRF